MIERHYFRCLGCLFAWSAEIDIPACDKYQRPRTELLAVAPLKSVRCPFECGYYGPQEHMGRVTGSIAVKVTGVKAECNEVCAHATGPLCSCKCGGLNHGAGVACYVTTTSVTSVSLVTPSTTDAAFRYAMWRQVLELLQTVDKCIEARNAAMHAQSRTAGFWSVQENIASVRSWNYSYSKYRTRSAQVKDFRSHSGRIKAALACAIVGATLLKTDTLLQSIKAVQEVLCV